MTTTHRPTVEEHSVALAREAYMRPTAEKLVDQWHRGLVTLGELAHGLHSLDTETPQCLPGWASALDNVPSLQTYAGCCRGCDAGGRCEVDTITADVPALTGDPMVDLVMVHAQGTFTGPLEGDQSGLARR